MTLRRALEPADYPFFDYRRFSFALGIAAAGRIWLSGSTAVRFEQGEGMAVKGNLIAQATIIHEKMKMALTAARRNLRDIVRIVRYVTPKAISDLPTLNSYQQEIFSDTVSISTVIVQSLLRPEALIEIEAIAYDGDPDGIDYLPSIAAPDRPAAWAKATKELRARGLIRTQVKKVTELSAEPGFDMREAECSIPGLRIGVPRLVTAEAGVQLEITVVHWPSSVIYVSAEGDARKGGVISQCRDLYTRLGAELVKAGASLNSVVKTTDFIVPDGLREYRDTADIRREVFAAPFPAATGVICRQLSQPGAMIAVEATALTEAE